MKTLNKLTTVLLFAVVALVLSGQSAFAQQYTLSNTTLNGAIGASDTTLVLTSASASSGSSFGAPAAGQCLFVDAELMRIVSMASTTATVQRAIGGGSGNASPHATLAVIWTGACNAFKQADPPNVTGNQTCSAQPRPWINIKNGNEWICSTATNKWTGTNFTPFTYNSVPIGQ